MDVQSILLVVSILLALLLLGCAEPFQEPLCGDGVCEAPREGDPSSPLYCESDCGEPGGMKADTEGKVRSEGRLACPPAGTDAGPNCVFCGNGSICQNGECTNIMEQGGQQALFGLEINPAMQEVATDNLAHG